MIRILVVSKSRTKLGCNFVLGLNTTVRSLSTKAVHYTAAGQQHSSIGTPIHVQREIGARRARLDHLDRTVSHQYAAGAAQKRLESRSRSSAGARYESVSLPRLWHSHLFAAPGGADQ